MYKKLSLSIALYGLLITPLSPLGVFESYNIVDFVDRNFQTDDQSKPNRVKTHYPLSYQSPNILTNIEGVPTREVQLQENLMYPYYRSAPHHPPELPNIVLVIDVSRESEFYIVKTVREFNRENMTNGGYLYPYPRPRE